MKQFLAIFWLCLFYATQALAATAPVDEVRKANIFLTDFEKEVARADGSETRFFNKQETLVRVQRLAKQYPDDPAVQDLVRRTKAALMRSKGNYLEITPEMVAYKHNEASLRNQLKKINQEAWQELLASKKPITNIFPAPVPEEVDISEYYGKYILLPEVRYPENQFLGATGEFISVGKPSSGYYFIAIDGRNWLGPYEAIRRYRSLVDASLGDNLKFTVLGKVTGLVMESPEASREKHSLFVWGWIVKPLALYVEDRIVSVYDPKRENSGYFYGEDQVEKIKESWYTVKSIPDNVDPKQLMEIFCTAIKEKNFQLYKDCIYPDRSASQQGSSLLRYHWDLHQARFRDEYVYVVFDEPKITVLKGYDDTNDLENFFLDEKQQATLHQINGEREEMAIVMSRAFDQNGKQRGSKNSHELRRKGNGRWYVNTYDIRF
ncbi:MAG: hypothetical protein IJU40_00810 [Desulfovibrionaceae bacterium]|nr:hypothetical protein [Desulfovibrionaceae bacterium]